MVAGERYEGEEGLLPRGEARHQLRNQHMLTVVHFLCGLCEGSFPGLQSGHIYLQPDKIWSLPRYERDESIYGKALFPWSPCRLTTGKCAVIQLTPDQAATLRLHVL
jgi:hypothetical protein